MRHLSLLTPLALAAALLAGPAAAETDAWSALAELRQRLESASPLTAEFQQTFIAAGFETGDSESGRVFIDLPACLRWDYEGDFPNSFLLCGHLAHGWNDGEASGRRSGSPAGDDSRSSPPFRRFAVRRDLELPPAKPAARIDELVGDS